MGSMLFLALIIVLVSGLIAYIGDLVGRKMGRKRLTLMGLRPRHTAIVISVGVGMLIALLTLSAALLVNKSVRDAFFTPLEQLKSDLVTQQRAVQDSQRALNAARQETEKTQAQVANQTQELAQLNQALDVSKQKRQQVHVLLLRAKLQLTDISARLKVKDSELRAKRTALEEAKGGLSRAKEELTLAQAEFARVSKDLTASQEQLQSSKEQLRVSQEQLKTSQEQYRVSQERVKASQDSLLDLNKKVREINDTRFALEDKIASLNEDVVTLNKDIKALSVFASIGFSPLSFTYGQEIVSGIIPTTGSEKDRRALLSRLLQVAETVVRQRSVELPKDSAALLFIAGGQENLAHVSAKDAIDTIMQRVNAMKDTDAVVIRLAPVNNVPINGPAFIAIDRLDLAPNTLAYSAGSAVTKVDMDIESQTTTADILGTLADDLLREKLPSALRAKGMLSISRRFDARREDAVLDASTPTVSWTSLMAAAEKARAYRGKVSLIARSRTNVTIYGPLCIDIDVVPAL